MERSDPNAAPDEPRGDSAPPAPRRSRVRRALLALAIGIGLPLVVAEVVVRMTMGVPLAERLPILRIEANPHRGWQMIPGETHYTYSHAVKVNALGLRGDEVEPKAPGERRVLALGDSLIYGQGVADEHTVPAQLEAALAEAQPDALWDVVNAGHRAYDTRQELALLDELGEAIDPDEVVVFWYWNDIYERDIEATFERLSASGPVHFDTGSTLEGSDRLAWHAKELLRRSALLMALWDELNSGGKPDAPGTVDKAFERLDDYLSGFVRRAEARGFALWFASIPDSGALQGEAPPSEAHRARADALAEAHGIAVIDLLPDLRALAEREGALPILPFDGHFDPAANAVIAATVARALTR